MSLQDSFDNYISGGSISGKKKEDEKKTVVDPFEDYIKSGKVTIPKKVVEKKPVETKEPQYKYTPGSENILNLDNNISVSNTTTSQVDESSVASNAIDKGLDVSLDVTKKVVKGGLDAYNKFTQWGDEQKLKSQITFEKVDGEFQKKQKYESVDEMTADIPLVKLMNTEGGKRVITKTGEYTSNIPLKVMAGFKAIGNDTYDEAFSAYMDQRNNPDNGTFTKFLYELQDSGPQSAIGILLSLGVSYATKSPKAGLAISSAYYAALSADEQLQERGKVDSLGNIGIDVIGDQLLGATLEGLFKDSVKQTLLKTAGKSFFVEGSTESAQSLLKFGNDYGHAKTDKEKQAVLTKAKEYITSGAMAMEFFVGGVAGGIIGGAVDVISKKTGGSNKDVNSSLQPDKKKEDEKPALEKQKDIENKNAVVENIDSAKIRDEVVKIEEEINDGKVEITDDLVQKVADLKDKLTDFEIFSKDKSLVVHNSEGEKIIDVDTIEYSDGKFGFTLQADIGGQVVSVPFGNEELYKSEKDAIDGAKSYLDNWIKENISEEVSAQVKKELDKIKTPELPKQTPGGIPIEYKKEDIEATDEVKKQNINKVSELYKENLKEGLKLDGKKDKIWKEQMQEQIDNPERYNVVIEDENPKGIKIGDKVNIKNKKNGDYDGIVTAVEKTEGKAYKGGYSIHTISPDRFGGWSQIDDVEKVTGEKTQKEKVEEVVKDGPKSIKEIAEATKIKEPNVRRILGVGAKEGTFERIEKGVYILSKGGEDIAFIETADAKESLARLVKEGDRKFNMVFLDPPYNAAGNRGGNRFNQKKGTIYELISPEEYKGVVEDVKKLVVDDNAPVVFMYSQSESSKPKMKKYMDVMIDAGFIPLAKGDYFKMTKKGTRFTKPLRPEALPPEGITIFNLSGESDFNFKEVDLQYKLVRPRGYKTEKPRELLKSLIEMTTKEGEIVLDPFAGSGVTGEQAVKSGRKAYLIEQNKDAVEDIIKPRLKTAINNIDNTSESIDNNNEEQTNGKQEDRQKGLPDAGKVSARDNLGESEVAPKELSGYDRATMLVESGDGLSGDRTAVLTKKNRQLINEQVEGLLELKEYSTNSEEYSQEDKELMANYSGAGGKESVGATGAGLLSEYYTPKIVIDKLWQLAENLNPNIETAFEPSAGTGKIINSSPVGIQVDGAEISKVSGTIAKILNPDSEITIGDFQEIFFDKTTNKQKPFKQYDLIIGNPPFGDRAGFLKGKGEESKINREEEYFIKRGLDMTVDGGYLIYVVNSSFLDKGATPGKEIIVGKGELISAYRLPENSFEDTSIGTDIVIFKKTGEPGTSEDRLNRKRLISDREYFRKNKDNVLGETKKRNNRFGKEEKYVTGNLEEAINNIKIEKGERITAKGARIDYYEDGDKIIISDLYVAPEERKKGVGSSLVNKVEDIAKKKGKDIQLSPISTETGIGNIYLNKFYEKRGYKKNNSGDSGAGMIKKLRKIGTEKETPKSVLPSTKKKTAIKPKTKKTPSVQTTLPKKNASNLVIKKQDVSNNKKVNPNEVNMLKRIDRDLAVPDVTESEKKSLYYENGKYYPEAIYFSGNIYNKIDKLKKDKKAVIENVGEDKYNEQLNGLEKITPKKLSIKDIVFDPMDRHIKEMKTTLDLRIGSQDISIENAFVRYIYDNDIALSPRVTKGDVARFVQGNKAAKDTKPIMGLIKSDAKRLFNEYLKNELNNETRKKVEDRYNKEKNGYVKPDYSRIPVSVSNMAKEFRGSEFKLSQTQKEGIGFLVNKGSGAISYGVGVGKTHTLAIATKANMDKGWTKRPLYIVPKSTIEDTWINTLHEMFPDLVINNLGGLQAPIVKKLKKERGDNPKDWIKDGEFTIISHEGLLRLGFNEDELRQAAGDLNDALWKSNATERQKEKEFSGYDEIIGNAQKYVTDIMFSDLGFDHISVDEVHNFRKIFQGAKPENVDNEGNTVGNKRYANVIGGTPSRRAQQLFLVSQNIQKNNNNRNVFLASATPFENHATEVYNILSLVARDRMKEMGLLNINDFFATFANFEVELDRRLDGEWINREKMKSFSNLPALQSLIKEFIDFQEDKTLIRPERSVITPQLPMSAKQEENLVKIQNLLMGVKDTEEGEQKGKVDDGAFLKASTYSIANSVSPYFIDEYTKNEPSAEQLVADSPKIEYALEAIKTMKNDPKTADYGNFVFLGKQGVKYHPMLATHFAKVLGYKESEVAYLSGNVSDEQKEDIKKKFNSGQIKVLLGGDQTKEGIDLQNNGFATINLALGWNPTQIQQVEGRVWRQGNKRSIAPLIYPLVENSGDAMIYNKFEEKGGRINDLFSYAGTMFDVGEIDPGEKKIALLTNPQDKAKQQIELNKLSLYNEHTLAENDKKEFTRLKTDLASAENSVEYYTSQVEDAQLEDRKKMLKNDLKKEEAKVKRIKERIKVKGIKSLADSIANASEIIIDIETKIKEIDKTYPSLLEKFEKEHRVQVKNRKTMAQHMEQIEEMIDNVKEKTDEEIIALRAKKIKDLEEQRKLVTGSAGASVGKYSDGTPVTLGGIENIKPLFFPDMVQLVKDLRSGVKINTRLKSTTMGKFQKEKGISLNQNLFEDGADITQAAKTLSHEIGHLADWLPDGHSDKGNVLGRILNIRGFLKNTFGDSEITNREIKNELWDLSKEWRPMPENYTDGFLKYRKSSSELYADAISTLFNNPGLLEKKAPNFYREFFNNLDKKPSVKDAYFSLQDDLVNGMPITKWRDNTKQGFAEAEEKAADIQKKMNDERFKALKKIPDAFKRYLKSVNTPVYDMVNKLEKNGVKIPDEQNPTYLLSNRGYLPDKINRYFTDKLSPIFETLEENSISWDQLGELLKYERVLYGDRQNIANPLGMQKEFMDNVIGNDIETPAKNMDEESVKKESSLSTGSLKEELGEERFNILENLAKDYRAMIKETALTLVDQGRYNEEARGMINSNDYYVPFRPVKYADKAVVASMKKQIGTLQAIENPATTGILKVTAMIRAREYQHSVASTIDVVKQVDPEGIVKADTRFVNGKMELDTRQEKLNELDKKGLGLITYYEGGKRVGYYIDKTIVDSLHNNTIISNSTIGKAIVKVLSISNQLPKKIYIDLSLAFQMRNAFFRDPKRSWKNLASLGYTNIFEYFYKNITSIPTVTRYALGREDELVKKMIEEGAIGEQGKGYIMTGDEETRYKNMLANFTGDKKTRMISRLGNFFGTMTTFGEGLSKISSYRILTDRGVETRKKAYIINTYVGTPNYYEKGKLTPLTNSTFLFSNVIIQGWSADAKIATDPKTRSGWWWRTTATTLLPKLFLYAMGLGLLGDWWKDWADKETDYKKTNYILLPIGKDENGKAVAFQIAEDEVSRVVGAAFWKALTAYGNEKNAAEDMRDIFSLFSGQLPTVTPVIDVPFEVARFATTGRAPYDSYRQKQVLNPYSNEAIAGGWPAWKKVLKYEYGKLGGNIFYKLDKFPSNNKTTLEKALDIPVLGNALGAIVNVSDYGITEKLNDQLDRAKKEKAKESLRQGKIIDKNAKAFRDSGSTSIFERNRVERETIIELLGGLPKNRDEKADATNIKKRFRLAVKKTANDPLITKLIYATNDEKVVILKNYKERVKQDEFDSIIKNLTIEQVISWDVRNKLK